MQSSRGLSLPSMRSRAKQLGSGALKYWRAADQWASPECVDHADDHRALSHDDIHEVTS
jgi:hypothetical protein